MQASRGGAEDARSGANGATRKDPPTPGKDDGHIATARKMAGSLGTALALTVITAVGTAIGTDFTHDPPLVVIALAVLVIVFCVLYFLGGIEHLLGTLSHRLRRGQPHRLASQPGTAAPVTTPPTTTPRVTTPRVTTPRVTTPRAGVVGLMCLLVVTAYLVGYWIIGNGFAHGVWPGLGSLLGTLILIAIGVTQYRRHRTLAWLQSGTRATLAAAVSVLGRSTCATLGAGALAPVAAAAPMCPAPTELRVLTSQEDLGAVQAAITAFERGEPAYLHQACYAVDLTAYAAPTDAAADTGLAGGWDLATDGPRPDIWIPASTAEVTRAQQNAGPGAPSLDAPRSIGSSPVVVAVPSALVTRSLSGKERGASWAGLYRALSADGIGLQVPNPRLSETALLGIAGLYPGLSAAQERQIEAPGSFPPDSENLLCAAAQAAEQAPPDGQGRRPTAYLVSAAALTTSNNDQLTVGACSTLTQPPSALTAFYPAGAAVLDFPFTTVTWGGGSPAGNLRGRYEEDFYRWLTSRAGGAALAGGWLMPPASISPPSNTDAALSSFTQAQAPAHILIAIDDSGPMQPYLPQIAAAVNADLGPSAAGYVGGRDSFGLWEFPGPKSGTYAQLVPFGQATPAQRAMVPAGASGLTGHAHSAEFDLLSQAAWFLNARQPTNSGSISSVVLLTDGDGYQPADPDGNSFGSVTGLLSHLTPGGSRIRVFIIAFGPAGCAQSASGDAGQSLAALANKADGTCLEANGADPRQLLGQVISQLSAGG
jgi:Ca-activated chloride channel homolog